MSEASLRAVIFDLDGVLVNTSRFHGQAWNELAQRLGITPPADLEERVKGISRMASLRIALGAAASRYSQKQLDEFADWKNRRYLELAATLTPADLFQGGRALLEQLRTAGIKVCLGSASKNAKPILESLGIAGCFDAVADGFSYRHGKPHHDVFTTAAKMSGATPAECIVVEDAAAGISAALDGGFVTVAMGEFESLKHAHLYVHGLGELSVSRLAELHAHCRQDAWLVVRDGTRADREPSLATLFCVGNGRLGVRGGVTGLNQPQESGIFLAGFYDRIRRPAHKPETWSPFMAYWGVPELARGEQIEVCIVNCPNFLDTRLEIEGAAVEFSAGHLKSLRRSLDLATGIYSSEAHWVSPQGKELRLVQRRLADRADTRRVCEQYELEPLNFSGHARITAAINTQTTNATELGPQKLYKTEKVRQVGASALAMEVKGVTDGMVAAFASGLRLAETPPGGYRLDLEAACPSVQAEIELQQGKLIYFDRIASADSARTCPDPMTSVAEALAAGMAEGFARCRIDSAAEWRKLWADSDVLIEGDADDQIGVRYSIYHLLIATSQDDPGVSIPAKSLSGEGFRGMVFWDTDIHMTPFFDFTQPRMARNLAAFRFNTLAGARRKAEKYGFKGASYPWETGVSGLEECEKWLKLITHQVHITADVAFALQQYVDCTGDMAFYEDCAAEVLVDTARFWLSKAVENPDGTLSIPDAAGPDEYHVVSDDSAYVNNLAIYNLRLADQAVEHLAANAPAKLKAVVARTGLSDSERTAFKTAQARIRTMRRSDGLLEQARGFFKFTDQVVRESPTVGPQHYQSFKQADVLMLLYLLPDEWDKDVVRRNWDYYEPRTIHGSSLSHAVHGILAAELGLPDKAEIYIRRSLGVDLRDERGNLSDGAHMAANGMNWTSIVRGYGGARPSGDKFLVSPNLPARWTRLKFRLKWRGCDFEVDITPRKVKVSNSTVSARALPVCVMGRDIVIEPGSAAS